MYFVQCPFCGAVVEVGEDAVGVDRAIPWSVTRCDECDWSFDYDDDEVQFDPDVEGVL